MSIVSPAQSPARLELVDGAAVRLRGAWVTQRLADAAAVIERGVREAANARRLDGSGIEALDTAGAWLLLRLERACGGLRVDGLGAEHAALLEFVRAHGDSAPAEAMPRPPPLLARLGEGAVVGTRKTLELLSFLGETVLACLRIAAHPARLRWRPLLAIVQRAGVQAIPIVALLSLLLGVVIAYQGGVQLRTYGANIFVVELIALTMTRELAPMMTAIIVAGRTGSAFAAELGTMKASEEIDALRTLALPPIEMLVVPRVLGLVVALPLLTLVADAAGILGGMIMAALMLDLGFADFWARLPQAMSATSFVIGIGKAPVFAVLIAIVGCFEGFAVRGGAEAVGRHTTISVVHGIFLVIVADAAFSVVFSWLGI